MVNICSIVLDIFYLAFCYPNSYGMTLTISSCLLVIACLCIQYKIARFISISKQYLIKFFMERLQGQFKHLLFSQALQNDSPPRWQSCILSPGPSPPSTCWKSCASAATNQVIRRWCSLVVRRYAKPYAICRLSRRHISGGAEGDQLRGYRPRAAAAAASN